MEADAFVVVKLPMPVMLLELPVIAPPKVKALMVVAPKVATPVMLLLFAVIAPPRVYAPMVKVPEPAETLKLWEPVPPNLMSPEMDA